MTIKKKYRLNDSLDHFPGCSNFCKPATQPYWKIKSWPMGVLFSNNLPVGYSGFKEVAASIPATEVLLSFRIYN